MTTVALFNYGDRKEWEQIDKRPVSRETVNLYTRIEGEKTYKLMESFPSVDPESWRYNAFSKLPNSVFQRFPHDMVNALLVSGEFVVLDIVAPRSL